MSGRGKKKLQLNATIENTLKQVDASIKAVEELWVKLEQAPKREKIEESIKAEVRKLQKHRETIRGWITNRGTKDTSRLEHYRRLIETEMERLQAQQRRAEWKGYQGSDSRAWIHRAAARQQKRVETIKWELSSIEGKQSSSKHKRNGKHQALVTQKYKIGEETLNQMERLRYALNKISANITSNDLTDEQINKICKERTRIERAIGMTHNCALEDNKDDMSDENDSDSDNSSNDRVFGRDYHNRDSDYDYMDDEQDIYKTKGEISSDEDYYNDNEYGNQGTTGSNAKFEELISKLEMYAEGDFDDDVSSAYDMGETKKKSKKTLKTEKNSDNIPSLTSVSEIEAKTPNSLNSEIITEKSSSLSDKNLNNEHNEMEQQKNEDVSSKDVQSKEMIENKDSNINNVNNSSNIISKNNISPADTTRNFRKNEVQSKRIEETSLTNKKNEAEAVTNKTQIQVSDTNAVQIANSRKPVYKTWKGTQHQSTLNNSFLFNKSTVTNGNIKNTNTDIYSNPANPLKRSQLNANIITQRCWPDQKSNKQDMNEINTDSKFSEEMKREDNDITKECNGNEDKDQKNQTTQNISLMRKNTIDKGSAVNGQSMKAEHKDKSNLNQLNVKSRQNRTSISDLFIRKVKNIRKGIEESNRAKKSRPGGWISNPKLLFIDENTQKKDNIRKTETIFKPLQPKISKALFSFNNNNYLNMFGKEYFFEQLSSIDELIKRETISYQDLRYDSTAGSDGCRNEQKHSFIFTLPSDLNPTADDDILLRYYFENDYSNVLEKKFTNNNTDVLFRLYLRKLSKMYLLARNYCLIKSMDSWIDINKSDFDWELGLKKWGENKMKIITSNNQEKCNDNNNNNNNHNHNHESYPHEKQKDRGSNTIRDLDERREKGLVKVAQSNNSVIVKDSAKNNIKGKIHIDSSEDECMYYPSQPSFDSDGLMDIEGRNSMRDNFLDGDKWGQKNSKQSYHSEISNLEDWPPLIGANVPVQTIEKESIKNDICYRRDYFEALEGLSDLLNIKKEINLERNEKFRSNNNNKNSEHQKGHRHNYSDMYGIHSFHSDACGLDGDNDIKTDTLENFSLSINQEEQQKKDPPTMYGSAPAFQEVEIKKSYRDQKSNNDGLDSPKKIRDAEAIKYVKTKPRIFEDYKTLTGKFTIIDSGLVRRVVDMQINSDDLEYL